MKAAHITLALHTPPKITHPHMAPTITAASSHSQEDLPLSHKLRKPLVEKLRRERINSSIEQLKSLLGPEFLKQQPDSKLEKADILEMTVCVLTRLQQQRQSPAVASVHRGYSRCVQQVEHFLSAEEVKTQRRLMNHINKLQSDSNHRLTQADFSPLTSTVHSCSTKDKAQVDSALWRPW